MPSNDDQNPSTSQKSNAVIYAPTPISIKSFFQLIWAVLKNYFLFFLANLLIFSLIVMLVVSAFYTNMVALGVAICFAAILATAWLLPVHIALFSAITAGKSFSIKSLLFQGRFFWRSLALVVIYMVVILVGLVLFIVPGIILAMVFASSPVIMVNEDVGPIKAMWRSIQLLKGYWGLRLAALATWLILAAAIFVLTPIAGALLTVPWSPDLTLSSMVSSVATAFILFFVSLLAPGLFVTTLFYTMITGRAATMDKIVQAKLAATTASQKVSTSGLPSAVYLASAIAVAVLAVYLRLQVQGWLLLFTFIPYVMFMIAHVAIAFNMFIVAKKMSPSTAWLAMWTNLSLLGFALFCIDFGDSPSHYVSVFRMVFMRDTYDNMTIGDNWAMTYSLIFFIIYVICAVKLILRSRQAKKKITLNMQTKSGQNLTNTTTSTGSSPTK